ncbi:hypothetical protein V8D89_004886 [Ganoderma adspersum]
MENLQPVAFACIAVIVAVYVVRWRNNPLRAIPTVGGSSLPGLSYIAALRNMGDIRAILVEGYRMCPDSAFKISMLDQWSVVVSGRDMVEDLRKRPNEEFAIPRGAQEVRDYARPCCQDLNKRNALPNPAILSILPALLPEVIDEVVVAVDENITTKGNEWASVEVMPAMQKIVARASNRAFVGLPLCRNEEYLALAIDFAAGFMQDSMAALFIPGFLRPIILPFISKVKHDADRTVPHLQPIVDERMAAFEALGEGWSDKPNDVLQLILDKAIAKGEAVSIITQRLLILNFAAIHTSSHVVSHVLYHLAENPELLPPLREEIQACISSDGWTTTTMGNMWKLDSILRETLRYYGITLIGMARTAKKDITLRDGTRIPKGSPVSANAYAQQHDPALLEHADKFDAFRYARMRSDAGESLKHQFTSTSPEYIPFGHGQYACPGRHFASNELKAILGHIILSYDLKLAGDGSRPPVVYFATAVVLPQHGRILFKKREPSG